MDTSQNDEQFLDELKKLTQKPVSQSNAFDKLKEKTNERKIILEEPEKIQKVQENNENETKITQTNNANETKIDSNLPMKEPEKDLTIQNNFLKVKELKPKNYSFENQTKKDLPEEHFEEYQNVTDSEIKNQEEQNKINEAKEKQKNTMRFNWEKRDVIEEPNENDFGETKLDWLKKEINKEPTDINKQKQEIVKKEVSSTNSGDLISELKKENKQTNDFVNKLSSEFDFEKENKIEEPLATDFSDAREELTTIKDQISGPKWKHASNKQKEINLEKETNEQKETNNITTIEKEEQVVTSPKWKHPTKRQEKKDEQKIENLKTIENTNLKKEKIITTPKWKHETNKSEKETSEKKEIATKIDEKKETNDLTNHSVNENKKEKLSTPIDEIFTQLEQNKSMDMAKLTKSLNLDYLQVEQIAKIFEDYGIVELKYSTKLNAKPKIILKTIVKSKIEEVSQGDILDEYSIEVDKVPADIKIIITKNESRPIYAIQMPAIGKYTIKFLEFLKNEIAENMPIELDEILDPKKSKKLKTRFFEESQKHLKKYFPTSSQKTLDILSGVVLHEMYGLGSIDVILGDDMLEEVAINSSKTPIAIYHKIHGWLKTNLYPGNEDEIMNYASQIGRKVGREITMLTPILDAHLLSGDRVNATLFPISSEGNTLTIRRFARKPWTLIDFIGKAHTMNSEMAALLWLAMQYEMNVIIAGGTASGKTSTLNTLLSLVPAYHRIISIEDVREIILPKYLKWNWIPLITRSANPEGLGEVTMLDCMVSSLRMRPDRIIVGEIRRKREAEVLMEAIETGHSIYSTIHANSAYQVLRRLAEPPMSIPLMQIELIDLVVVQFRDRKTNKRRTFELAEVEQTSTGKGLQVNTIYKWVPRTDSWEQLNKPTKLLTLLNLHTGLTEDEINKELDSRAKILDWMKEVGMNELDMIGFVMKLFYAEPQRVKQMSINKTSVEEIRGIME